MKKKMITNHRKKKTQCLTLDEYSSCEVLGNVKQELCQDPWEVFEESDYEQYYDIVQEELINEYCNQIGKIV